MSTQMKKPLISIEPHPADVIEVTKEILDALRARLQAFPLQKL